MKKIMLVGVLLLSGCSSLNFDSLAFDRFVSISERADKLSEKCSDADYVRDHASILLDNVTHMNNYAVHRGATPEINSSVATLHSMVQEFNDRYQKNMQPSKVYCEQKLKTISTAASAISDTLGRLN